MFSDDASKLAFLKGYCPSTWFTGLRALVMVLTVQLFTLYSCQVYLCKINECCVSAHQVEEERFFCFRHYVNGIAHSDWNNTWTHRTVSHEACLSSFRSFCGYCQSYRICRSVTLCPSVFRLRAFLWIWLSCICHFMMSCVCLNVSSVQHVYESVGWWNGTSGYLSIFIFFIKTVTTSKMMQCCKYCRRSVESGIHLQSCHCQGSSLI